MKNALVNLVNISKSFDNQMVLDDLNLYIRENEFLTLLGPSGCGKTTTLRILGGFETPDKGQVIFEGRDITNLPPNKRNLNTVFQKYALFPHMTIAENIAFGLKISGKSKSYINDKIKYALKLVNFYGTAYKEHLDELICREECASGMTFVSDNIMDYSISYADAFTPEQQERVRYILEHAVFIPGPKAPRTAARSRSTAKLDLPFELMK